ncbi:mechanosensitive ion channel domain-containing protein [Vibrio variabilis]|uniref:mechanosensitive ion channel domain-containing protein n=1 Tax=Vibrio variabilis TaxID=990271 RepID=UPI0030B85126
MGTLAGSFCAVCVIGYGLHRLGVPVYGIVTGLSLGGMAIALAIRPTMENLIGGVIMFMDKSLSVGDFCSVGSVSGVVEQIGVRSTGFVPKTVL